MKVAVYAIALNEEAFIERWLESAADADTALIVDTGSTDQSLVVLHDLVDIAPTPINLEYETITVRPWRFDIARNAALALLPADIDVCIALDMDEVLMPGWREALERAWLPGTTRLRHPFAFKEDEAGKPTEVMYGHRIHGRHDYYWRYPIHEVLWHNGSRPESIVYCDDLWIHHRTVPKSTRANYLPMMAKAAGDDPACERMAFYHARELMFGNHHERAIAEFKRYLALPTATWDDQRAEAMRYIGRCMTAIGNAAASEWFMRATLECPGSRQAWTELAENRRQNQDWLGGMWAASHAMELPMPREGLYDVKALTAGPYDIAGICAHYSGDPVRARRWLEHAASLYPDDARMADNVTRLTPA